MTGRGPVRVDDELGLGTGDLGRRITARRTELGLTRTDLALRSGISLPYLRYLESEPSHPPTETLRTLARVLRTTDDGLLGGNQGRPPGQGAPTAGSRLAVLSERECWALLADHGVGRVAFAVDGEVIVVPVNYAAARRTLWIRTSPDSELAAQVRPRGRVTVEVDRLDDVTSGGWSVLAHGPARRRATSEFDPFDADGVDAEGVDEEGVDVRPWVQQDRSLLLSVRPDAVSGRRITW